MTAFWDRTIEPGEWPKNRNGDAKQLNIGIQCDLMGFNGIQWDIGYPILRPTKSSLFCCVH